jgi:DNA-3-methyladenine glycosylase II
MDKKVLNHFRKTDKILFSATKRIKSLKRLKPSKHEDLFAALCRAIIYQQLSGKVGNVIYARFLKLFPNGKIEPKRILKLPAQKIRNVGTSWGKVDFMKDLAKKVVSRETVLENLHKLDDESVIQELTKVKGIGRWTAEMFLMFSLGREDVFSPGDLGLRRSMEKLYGIREITPIRAEKIAEKWSPYRTYASLALWAMHDN